jgi:hypothetical protein
LNLLRTCYQASMNTNHPFTLTPGPGNDTYTLNHLHGNA